ncbi:unnamed protein product [Cunninghamella blakesleeana]
MTGSETLPVIIIGAGLAGLALAQSLKHQKIPYEIYEREECQRNNQGWSMSIHFCLPVLAANVSPDYFKTIGESVAVNPSNPQDVQFCLIDGKTNEIHVKVDPKDFSTKDGQQQEMYRVNRKRFRNWLLQDIDVHWGKQVDQYNIMDDGIEVQFKDGEKIKGSCLVGADGVHSSICHKIIGDDSFNKATTVNPVYDLVVRRWLSDEDYKRIRKISRTFFMAFGKINKKYDYDGDDENLACFVSLNDQDFTSDKPHDVIFAISRYDPESKLPRYDNDADRLKLFKQWATQALDGDLLNLILETPDDYPVTQLIVRERYPQVDALKNHQGRITLIGDAAHAMTMFRGEGANHAILDAALLGNQFVKAYNNEISFYEAIEQYQEEMIPRGTKAVTESHNAAENCHSSPEIVVKSIILALGRFKS